MSPPGLNSRLLAGHVISLNLSSSVQRGAEGMSEKCWFSPDLHSGSLYVPRGKDSGHIAPQVSTLLFRLYRLREVK